MPAAISNNGTREWWVDGKRHRNNDLPALIFNNGNNQWWVDGKRHREGNLPAIIRTRNLKKTRHMHDNIHTQHEGIIKENLWFYKDHKYRINDLPTTMYNDDVYTWYYLKINFNDIHFDDDSLYYKKAIGYKTIYVD